jgi:hypothetical protein
MNCEQNRREAEAVYWSARERWGKLTTNDLQTVICQIKAALDEQAAARL